MSNQKELWTAMQDAQGAVVQQLVPAVQEAIQESIFNGVQGWGYLGFAMMAHPDALTVEGLQVRNPYSRASVLEGHIQTLHDAKFLDERGVITQDAYDGYQTLVDAQDAHAKALDLLDSDKMATVNQLLERVIDDALKNADNLPVLRNEANEDLQDDPVHRFYDLINRFRALRDDVHLNAWRPTGIDGHAHEAFSLIWDGSADGATKLLEIRGNRGYEESDWQATLDAIVEKGWLVKAGDTYSATDTGNIFRQEIEDKTDDAFYAPFSVLSDDEINTLLELLKEIGGLP